MTSYVLYYEELNLSEGAGEDEIKKAYKRLALRHHPDKNQGDSNAAKKFLSIGEAYEKLIKHVRGEESDEDREEEFDDKEAELEMLIRELARERAKEKRRREQEKWEEEFKMEQMKKRLQREREERNEEFLFKEAQIKRERQQRDESLRRRATRATGLQRAATTSNFHLFTPSYTSYAAYSSVMASSPASSYSDSLTAKWLQDGGDSAAETRPNGATENPKKGDKSESETKREVSFAGPGSAEGSSREFYSSRRRYQSEGSSEEPATGPSNIGTPSSQSTTPHLPSLFTSADLLPRSADHSPSTEFSSAPFSPHVLTDYWSRRSSSSVYGSADPFLSATSHLSSYSRSSEDLLSREASSSSRSEEVPQREAGYTSSQGRSEHASYWRGESESGSGYNSPSEASDSWAHSLPKRRSKSDRLAEQIEWEKQFFRDTERRRKKREEEERIEEERLRLDLQNQQLKMNMNLRNKQRWEERFANFPSSYPEEMGTTYSSFLGRSKDQSSSTTNENE